MLHQAIDNPDDFGKFNIYPKLVGRNWKVPSQLRTIITYLFLSLKLEKKLFTLSEPHTLIIQSNCSFTYLGNF